MVLVARVFINGLAIATRLEQDWKRRITTAKSDGKTSGNATRLEQDWRRRITTAKSDGKTSGNATRLEKKKQNTSKTKGKEKLNHEKQDVVPCGTCNERLCDDKFQRSLISVMSSLVPWGKFGI